MKLVLLLKSSSKYRHAVLPLSTKLHLKNIDAVPFLTVGVGGQLDMDISTPRLFRKALWTVCDRVGDNNFVLSSDNVFPVDRFDPSILRCRKKSNWNKRKGEEVSAMVGSIQYLMDFNTRLFDYEMDIPRTIDSGKMQAVLATTEHMDIHAITTYFNTYHEHPERYDDPYIELWTHFMDPKVPVVSMSDTCYRHKKCLMWLSKKTKQ